MHKVEEITITAKAPSLEASLSKLAITMFDIVVKTENIELVQTKTTIIRARDLKNLVYQFMKRLYDLASNELFLLSTVKQITIEQVSNEYLLTAVLIGDKMNENYEIKDIIKQVTDRNILVKEDRTGTYIQINLVVERRNIENEV